MNSLVAHSLSELLFCPWARGTFCNHDAVIFCGAHPTSWLPWKPINFFFFSFSGAQEHWTLEVFFSAVCEAGC